jgi:hypothetical protein
MVVKDVTSPYQPGADTTRWIDIRFPAGNSVTQGS